jgi:hypothetical protein
MLYWGNCERVIVEVYWSKNLNYILSIVPIERCTAESTNSRCFCCSIERACSADGCWIGIDLKKSMFRWRLTYIDTFSAKELVVKRRCVEKLKLCLGDVNWALSFTCRASACPLLSLIFVICVRTACRN